MPLVYLVLFMMGSSE